MCRLKCIVFIAFLGLGPSANAHVPEEGKISGVLGPYIYRTNYGEASPSVDSPVLGGAGLLVEGDVDKNGGLEVGLFYMHKLYIRRIDSQYESEKIKIMYITMGYR